MKLEWRQFKATIVLGISYFRISRKDEIIFELEEERNIASTEGTKIISQHSERGHYNQLPLHCLLWKYLKVMFSQQ